MMLVVCGPLRRLVGFQRGVRIDASTVSQGLRSLCESYPDMERVLFDEAGHLRGIHMLALNNTMLDRSHLETPVGEDDEVELLTALAGG